jgi:hypothetical protein
MSLARFQRTIVDANGNIIASPTIAVRDQVSNGLVSIFSDRAGLSALSNPFTGTSEGLAAFHVEGGAYKITATSGAFTAEWTWVGIGTAQELDLEDIQDFIDTAISILVPDPLTVERGGTGRDTLTSNNLLAGNGTGTVNLIAPGSSGNVLTSNGSLWASSALPQQITATTGSPAYYAARAWVNFDGTTSPGTIRSSVNVSSVTRNSTGNYTVNFTTAMPDDNYCAIVTAKNSGITESEAASSYSTSGFTFVVTRSGTGAINVGFCNVAIFR